MIRYFVYGSVIILVSIIMIWAGPADRFFFTKASFEKTPGDQKKFSQVSAQYSDAHILTSKGREAWSRHVDEAGVEIAYENFKREYKSGKFRRTHFAAHAFGELIYERTGAKGVAICDTTFSFACYHSFFVANIKNNGLAIIPDLEEGCIEKFGPLEVDCVHGIGHGLLQYIGHDEAIAALNECAKLSWQKPLRGCQSGVFMEHNFPTLIDSTGAVSSIREFDISSPYFPCTEVPERFRQACYFEIVDWWYKSGVDFKKIGELCGAIENKKEEGACYLGAGDVAAPQSDYDPALALSYCKEMGNSEGELFCRAGASWGFFSVTERGFFSVPEKRALAPVLCEGLDQDVKRRCGEISSHSGVGEIFSIQ